MILITSTLVLFTISLGHGNPLPNPNPYANLEIYVRQVIHQRYCKKPHDQEGPKGHPTTPTPVGTTAVDVEALEEEKEELEAEIAVAKEELEKTEEEVTNLENEVAEEEEEIAALEQMESTPNPFADFGRRKRESVYENVKEVLGRLEDLFEGSHRNRRQTKVPSTEDQIVTYCPSGQETDTGISLATRALEGWKDALVIPEDLTLASCFNSLFWTLHSATQWTASDGAVLGPKYTAALDQIEITKKAKEDALAAKKAELAKKKAEKEELEKVIQEKEEEKEAIEQQIVANKAETTNKVETTNKAETTEPPATTIEATVITTEEVWVTKKLPITTTPKDEE